MPATPDDVFDVLEEARSYPRWVVGTRRIRRVDPTWPAVGSKFHHAIGNTAAELHDSSKVLESDRPHRIVLEVRFRPTGVALVEIEVEASESGSVVTLTESPTNGLASHLPRFFTDPVLSPRNAISQQRLRHEVERSRASQPGS